MNHDGMLYNEAGEARPGEILKLWLDLRKRVGNVALKQKTGMKFKTRAATDTYDQVRAAADELGVLIYPYNARGEGKVVDNGTLCDVTLDIVCQAVSDGSAIRIAGYGLGADTQDKAGGKAGTYAFKQALIQACLAGGEKTPKKDRIPDTDDEAEPIPGGVKPKSSKPSQTQVEDALKAATDEPGYRAALELLKQTTPEAQVALKSIAKEAKARCVPVATVG
jgi:hypothetical protein